MSDTKCKGCGHSVLPLNTAGYCYTCRTSMGEFMYVPPLPPVTPIGPSIEFYVDTHAGKLEKLTARVERIEIVLAQLMAAMEKAGR